MNQCKMSVIIPAYNCAEFIPTLLKQLSCLDTSQIEVIAINDGSTDQTMEILKELKKSMPFLTLIDQTNHGVSYTRNRGIQLASGRYLLFLDSDDEIIPENLNAILEQLDQWNTDLLFFGLIDRFISKDKVEDIRSHTYVQTLSQQEFMLDFSKFLNDTIIYSPCNKIYKKEIISQYGVAFREDLPWGEDVLFNLDYFSHCSTIRFTDHYVYIYNHLNDRHDTGSTIYNPKDLDITVQVAQATEALLRQHNVLEQNQNGLNAFLLKRINNLMYGLFKPTCPLTPREKKDKIKKICSVPLFRNVCLSHIDGLTIKYRIPQFFYRHRSAQIIYSLLKLKVRLLGT